CRLERSERCLPVLLARLSDDGINLIVWCPFCRFNHYHGTFGDPTGRDGEGHRVAHCIDDGSPFKKTGYLLRLDREGEEMKKSIKKDAGVKPAVKVWDHTQIIDWMEDG